MYDALCRHFSKNPLIGLDWSTLKIVWLQANSKSTKAKQQEPQNKKQLQNITPEQHQAHMQQVMQQIVNSLSIEDRNKLNAMPREEQQKWFLKLVSRHTRGTQAAQQQKQRLHQQLRPYNGYNDNKNNNNIANKGAVPEPLLFDIKRTYPNRNTLHNCNKNNQTDVNSSDSNRFQLPPFNALPHQHNQISLQSGQKQQNRNIYPGHHITSQNQPSLQQSTQQKQQAALVQSQRGRLP